MADLHEIIAKLRKLRAVATDEATNSDAHCDAYDEMDGILDEHLPSLLDAAELREETQEKLREWSRGPGFAAAYTSAQLGWIDEIDAAYEFAWKAAIEAVNGRDDVANWRRLKAMQPDLAAWTTAEDAIEAAEREGAGP